MAHIEAGLEREREARDVAAEVGVGAALEIGGIEGLAVRGGERVAADGVGVDDGSGGVVGDGDGAGAQVVDVGVADVDVLTAGLGVVEMTMVDVLVVARGVRVAGAGLDPPDRPGVHVGERRHVDAPADDADVVREPDLAGAAGAAHGRRGEIAGRDAIHEEIQRPVVGVEIDEAAHEPEREAVAGEARHAMDEIERDAERIPLREFRLIADGEVGEVGAVGCGVGQGAAVGGERGAAETALDEIGAGVDGRAAGRERETEARVDRDDGGEVEAGSNLRLRLAHGAGRGVEMAFMVAQRDVTG